MLERPITSLAAAQQFLSSLNAADYAYLLQSHDHLAARMIGRHREVTGVLQRTEYRTDQIQPVELQNADEQSVLLLIYALVITELEKLGQAELEQVLQTWPQQCKYMMVPLINYLFSEEISLSEAQEIVLLTYLEGADLELVLDAMSAPDFVYVPGQDETVADEFPYHWLAIMLKLPMNTWDLLTE